MDHFQVRTAIQPTIWPSDQILHIVGKAPEFNRLQRQQNIRLSERLLTPSAMVVFVAAGEIHPCTAVDYRRVQQFWSWIRSAGARSERP